MCDDLAVPKVYPNAFRQEVVAVALESGLPRRLVAQEYGITVPTLVRWLAAEEVVATIPARRERRPSRATRLVAPEGVLASAPGAATLHRVLVAVAGRHGLLAEGQTGQVSRPLGRYPL